MITIDILPANRTDAVGTIQQKDPMGRGWCQEQGAANPPIGRKKVEMAYDFLPLLSKSVFSNTIHLLGGMTPWYYSACPSNLAFHDLTPGKVVPPADRSLLGLSL